MRNISSRCFCAGLCLLLSLPLPIALRAQDKNTLDTLVLTDGNTLRGKLVKEVGGTLTFHTEALGDLDVKWANVKELHTTQNFAVLNKNMKRRSKTAVESLPMGQVNATSESVVVQPSQQQRVLETIPVKNAQVIVDQGTLDKELNHEPGFLTGWNGAATAGATLVKATQNQYTFSGSVGLVRMVPTVSWLDTRNRSSLNFSDSFGKITQPAYTVGGVTIPATSTKSSILHFDAERDQYFSPRLFALVQTAFDHNFSQDLDLQQIYGAGIGWTAVKQANQELDLKTTLQYESQQFIVANGIYNQNLIGSTLDATWAAKLPLKVLFKQQVSWIPAYNNPSAYSAGEKNSVTMPFFRSLAFSVGTIDSYLNDPPPASPPTRRNSFQFTTGLTYVIKSNY